MSWKCEKKLSSYYGIKAFFIPELCHKFRVSFLMMQSKMAHTWICDFKNCNWNSLYVISMTKFTTRKLWFRIVTQIQVLFLPYNSLQEMFGAQQKFWIIEIHQQFATSMVWGCVAIISHWNHGIDTSWNALLFKNIKEKKQSNTKMCSGLHVSPELSTWYIIQHVTMATA